MRYVISVSGQILEGSCYQAFGIRCEDEEIHDLARDASILEPLLQRCNEMDLDPLHLRDVAEDFVADLAEPIAISPQKSKNRPPIGMDGSI